MVVFYVEDRAVCIAVCRSTHPAWYTAGEERVQSALISLLSPVAIAFFDRIKIPTFSFGFAFRSASVAGIDIGTESVKVVQLKKEGDRGVLETYGELKSARYFEKDTTSGAAGFIGYRDESIANLLRDVLREAKVTTRRTVFAIPSTASFVTTIHLPLLPRHELEAAIPFEAKKYIPIPIPEVALDWQILEPDTTGGRVTVLLAAVPREVVTKFQRIAELLQLDLEAAEIENFSLVRSLLSNDRGVSALIQWGGVVSTITIVDQRRIRSHHNFGRGSREITSAIARSLGVSVERAEAVKREVGFSEKPEEQEIVGVIAPVVDSILADIERVMTVYNRGAKRKIERLVLTGGGAHLKGLVDHVAKRFGLETIVGNPFTHTVFPPFLHPTLKEIAPNFAVAVGLALRDIVAV